MSLRKRDPKGRFIAPSKDDRYRLHVRPSCDAYSKMYKLAKSENTTMANQVENMIIEYDSVYPKPVPSKIPSEPVRPEPLEKSEKTGAVDVRKNNFPLEILLGFLIPTGIPFLYALYKLFTV